MLPIKLQREGLRFYIQIHLVNLCVLRDQITLADNQSAALQKALRFAGIFI